MYVIYKNIKNELLNLQKIFYTDSNMHYIHTYIHKNYIVPLCVHYCYYYYTQNYSISLTLIF